MKGARCHPSLQGPLAGRNTSLERVAAELAGTGHTASHHKLQLEPHTLLSIYHCVCMTSPDAGNLTADIQSSHTETSAHHPAPSQPSRPCAGVSRPSSVTAKPLLKPSDHLHVTKSSHDKARSFGTPKYFTGTANGRSIQCNMHYSDGENGEINIMK